MLISKNLKDLSLKPRFIQNYGFDEDFFQKSMSYIKYWQNKLFYVEEKTAGRFTSDNIQSIDSNCFPDITVQDCDLHQLLKELDLNSLIEVETSTGPSTLHFGDSTRLNGRCASAINTGGIITSVTWLPKTLDNKSYVAVLVLNSELGVDDAITNPDLSIFSTTTSMISCIQLWQYDLDTQNVHLYKIFDTTLFGNCSNLQWTHTFNQSDSLGMLAGCFKDGQLHFFKIDANGSQASKITKPSTSYQLMSPRYPEKVSIICFDMLLNDRAIVGTSDGCIAEFVMPFFNGDTENENNIEIPSFLLNISESPITYVSVGSPHDNKYIIHANCTGAQNYAFDYDYIRVDRLDSFDSIVRPKYHPFLKIFICVDAVDTISYAFARSPQERPVLMIKSDGVVTSTAVSKHVNHPLVLIGNSFGEIFVVNVARKILASSKATNKNLVPLRLWKLHYKGPNLVFLDSEYLPVNCERTTVVAVSPPEINISSISWNETLDGSSLFAAGTHCGLLLFERLDPIFTN